RGDQAQRLADERGRSVGDEGARALARLDDPHRGEGAESGADAGAADAHLSSQLALGGEAVAGPQRPALDQAAHVRDDVLRGDGGLTAVRRPCYQIGRFTGMTVQVEGPSEVGSWSVH